MKKIIFWSLLSLILVCNVYADVRSDLYNNCAIYYRMDEASSPLIDSTFADIDTNANCTPLSPTRDCPIFQQTGIIDYAPHFDGVNDSFKTIPNLIMDSGINPFTVNIWFNMDDFQRYNVIFGQGITTPYLYIYWSYPTPSTSHLGADLYLSPLNRLSVSSPNNIITTSAEWHMATLIRRTSNSLEIWLDGVNVTTSTYFNCATCSITEDEYYIGGQGTGVDNFDGYLDEFSYYPIALNQSHIQYLYASGSPDTDQQFNFSIGTSIYQCNDGIDNDLDGFTDYPDDPSCSGVTDNDEFPVDYSGQDEDDCLVILNCVIYDSIPYSDSPFLHGWYGGQISDAHITGFLGGFSIDLDTIDEFDIKENVIIYKDNQNTNNYNTLYGQFSISVIKESGGSPISQEPIYLGFLDSNDEGVAWIVLNISTYSPENFRAEMYAFDGNHWTFIDYIYFDDSDYGFFNIEFDLDEQNKKYQLQWTDFHGFHTNSGIYDYDSSGIGQISKAMATNTLDRNDAKVLFNLIELTGTDQSELQTYCTTWTSPYHLKENFNGYMSQCDWNVNPDIFFYGKLSMQNEINNFMLYKIFDSYESNAIYYQKSRYATVKFNLTVYDDSDSLTALKLYLYDLSFNNAFVRASFNTNGNVYASENLVNTLIYDSLVTDVKKEVMIVIDLVDDEFDFYYDGVLRESNIGFHDEFLNVDYFNGIYIQSVNSHYVIDNLVVYESSDDGEESTNPIDIKPIPDATKSWCNLFSKSQTQCNDDSDCESDDCLPNGYCNHFDMTYCDEKGKTRGSYCVISAIAYCTLTSTGSIILDNFFLFLVFLVIMMGLIYVILILRH